MTTAARCCEFSSRRISCASTASPASHRKMPFQIPRLPPVCEAVEEVNPMSESGRASESEDPKPAVGFGPNAGGGFSQEDYHHPAAGWGAAKSVSLVILRNHEVVNGARVVFKMNHENGGFDCPGC